MRRCRRATHITKETQYSSREALRQLTSISCTVMPTPSILYTFELSGMFMLHKYSNCNGSESNCQSYLVLGSELYSMVSFAAVERHYM